LYPSVVHSKVVPISKEFLFPSCLKAIKRSHPCLLQLFPASYVCLQHFGAFHWGLRWKMNVWGAFIEVRGFCRNFNSETLFSEGACLWANFTFLEVARPYIFECIYWKRTDLSLKWYRSCKIWYIGNIRKMLCKLAVL